MKEKSNFRRKKIIEVYKEKNITFDDKSLYNKKKNSNLLKKCLY